MELLSISLDNKPVPGLENLMPDNGIATEFNVTHVPALYLVDFQSNQHHIIKQGMDGMDGLTATINEVIDYEKL